MNFEIKVNEVFQKIAKGKEIKKEMAIKELGIDSLDLVEAITDIEEILNIRFEDEEMLSFTYVKDVYDLIEKKLK